MKLPGKAFIITGAGRGLGRAIAGRYAREGASLVLTSRTASELADCANELARIASSEQRITTLAADLAASDTAEALVTHCLARLGRLDGVVCNAGQIGPIGTLAQSQPEAWEAVFACNLFGHVRLCRVAVPRMAETGGGKLILLSGGGATAPLPGFTAYAASKAALVRFAETLSGETQNDGISVNTVAPGVLDTRMTRTALSAGPAVLGAAYVARLQSELERAETTLREAVDLCLFLAGPESDGITGRLISARWDRWRDWPQHRDALAPSDAYTLRRITGRDRALDWGDNT